MALPNSQATWDLQEETRFRPMRQYRGEGVGGAADVVGFGRPIIQKEAAPGTQPPQITEGTSRPPPMPGRKLFGFPQKQRRSVLPYIDEGEADANASRKTIITRNVPGQGSLQRNWNEFPANRNFSVGLGMRGSCSGLGAQGGNAARRKVEEILDLFHEKCKEFLAEKKRLTGSDWTRAYERAANDLKFQGRWVNTSKRLGDIPGIEIGDWFLYRAELCVVGLHHQFARGIDYMGQHGHELATSIIVTDRYDNQLKPSGELVYCGEGENPSVSSRKKKIRDQKLTCGNRAMFNSKEANKPVRVVLKERAEKVKPYPFRGNHERSSTKYVYVYDGLYLVTDGKQVRGKNGKLVFKFTLKRLAEKPARGLSTNLNRCMIGST